MNEDFATNRKIMSPCLGKVSLASIYSAFIVFLFLVPTFSGILESGGTYWGAIIQVAYAAAFLSILLFILFNKRRPMITYLASVFSFLGFLVLILVALFRDADRVVISDFFEIYKPVFALLAFLPSMLIDWDDEAVGKVATAYTIVIAVSSIYALFETMGGQPFQDLATLLYKSDRPGVDGKATGTFHVTYFFAAFMIFGTSYVFIRFIYDLKLRFLSLTVTSVAALLLSQSRSGILALAVMFGALFLLYWVYKNFRRKINFYTISVFGICIISYIVYKFLPIDEMLPYLVDGITYILSTSLAEAGETNSFTIRYQQIQFAIQSQDEFPLFGIGIGKGYVPLLESYYALYFFRYGVIGIILSMLIILAFFVLSLRAFNLAVSRKEYRNASLFLAMHLWIFALPIVSLSNALHDQGKLAFFFYGGLGILVSYSNQRRQGRLTLSRGTADQDKSAANAI